ncbi:diaminopropionate ammonia-lyase [Aneurinibacillus danicus]|uniref:PLP-dependent lyase/thiolase n=1 Tax=Aneurinibacillus danicus TaxID=267746 RepID=A0A511VE87_9BACL|nr:diaminopropionate ammonia-lyase [Aneurinibacillus danicus]GEN35582.1 PLP-dependent lyase/thiolase [Aneurinibacillus danicus]
METLQWTWNNRARQAGEKPIPELFTEEKARSVRAFHQTFSGYQPTPLRSLSSLAGYLGIKGMYVKDESYRFGLNAFKALGGSYAIGRYLAGRLGREIETLSFEELQSPAIRQQLGEITFASATDGNHGRGVAWAAAQFGQKSVIYMPKGSAAIRLENIRRAGARAEITNLNYDDTVRLMKKHAELNGWVLVQDTAWDGYEEIPAYIMQGYMTMVMEALEQMQADGITKPTHVFVQVGVGSIAGAVQGLLVNLFGEERPVTVIVEPNKADCHYRSALTEDGKREYVTGPMDTMMAGLACGEPNPLSWSIMRDYSDMFVSCPDYTAAHGMRLLGNPLRGDEKVISGESGAVTSGLVSLLMRDESLHEAKERLGLNKDSVVLVFNTEGDTDPENYLRVVWDGLHPNER